MRTLATRMLLGVTALAAAQVGGIARAQSVRGGSAGNSPAPITSPYANPYANPYLNPALTVGTTNRNDALLYLWAAQQQPGALLGPPLPRDTARASRSVEIGTSAMTPGGGASRYFQRGDPTRNAQAGRYQRRGRFFSR